MQAKYIVGKISLVFFNLPYFFTFGNDFCLACVIINSYVKRQTSIVPPRARLAKGGGCRA